MIEIKTLQEIYNSIRDKIIKKSNIDIEKGTVIDSFLLATSEMILAVENEIEENKNPHMYSQLSGENLDDMGILLGLTRRGNESDKNFLYRILKWNTSNKASNYDSIKTALMDMEYCSHVTYVPLAYGCGTAAAYIIPKNMTEEYKKYAIEETKTRLYPVVSPSSYIDYIIPEILSVKLNVLYKADNIDLTIVKNEVDEEIIKYINNIGPGDYLEIGVLNKIGVNKANISYFNISNIFVNSEEIGDVSILQKVETKLLIDSSTSINWIEVE